MLKRLLLVRGSELGMFALLALLPLFVPSWGWAATPPASR
jgi:hypothetical protein